MLDRGGPAFTWRHRALKRCVLSCRRRSLCVGLIVTFSIAAAGFVSRGPQSQLFLPKARASGRIAAVWPAYRAFEAISRVVTNAFADRTLAIDCAIEHSSKAY